MEKISFTIPCKPYVKKYLENRCGSPADLSKVDFIQKYFLSLLSRNKTRYDSRIKLQHHTEEIELHISLSNFERYGDTLSKTAIVDFNKFLEEIVKENGRAAVALVKLNGEIKVAEAIRRFQMLYNFEEDDFSFETIKKDLQRHVPDFAKYFEKNFGATVPKKVG
jgi:hypothetical protein